MIFYAVIGNPPYQKMYGGYGASAIPIYNLFLERIKTLNHIYSSIIMPSRWMTGGRWIDNFRKTMLSDKHILVLHDYLNSKNLFDNVDIKGGICYFLRNNHKEDKCYIVTHTSNEDKISERYLKEDNVDVFIRYSELIDIKNKVWKDMKQKSFSDIVSVRKPYGFRTDFFAPTVQKEIEGKKIKVNTTTEEKYGLESPSDTPIKDGYEIIGLLNGKRVWKYLSPNYNFPKKDGLGKYKIFITEAYGCGAIGEVPSTPVLGTPVQVCTETFLEIGKFNTQKEANTCLKYLNTKFFRCLVGITKQTQDASNRVYKYVPIQDFTDSSDIDWSKSIAEIDKQLYSKYNLNQKDIDFIENNIRKMK